MPKNNKNEEIIERAQYDHVYAVEQLKKALVQIERLKKKIREE